MAYRSLFYENIIKKIPSDNFVNGKLNESIVKDLFIDLSTDLLFKITNAIQLILYERIKELKKELNKCSQPYSQKHVSELEEKLKKIKLNEAIRFNLIDDLKTKIDEISKIID